MDKFKTTASTKQLERVKANLDKNNMTGYIAQTKEEAVEIAKSILKEVDNLYQAINSNIHKRGIPTTLTYRTCLCEDDKRLSIDEVIARCEIARTSMYMPLEGNIVIFEDSMIQKNIDEMELAQDIDNAIRNREFEVYYQPKFDLKAEKFTGAEALIRWRHPTKGLVSPGTFIPFAERNDQIIDIDRYTFDRVCQDLAYWKKRGSRLVNISVNLSRNGIYRTDYNQRSKGSPCRRAVSRTG